MVISVIFIMKWKYAIEMAIENAIEILVVLFLILEFFEGFQAKCL